MQDHAIAENGGIILHGFAPGSEQRFGSKDEPTKVRDFLFENNDGVKLDMNQGIRITEIIILKSKTLTKQNIDYAIKQTKADAQVLASKTSFHISKKGINKGTAIDELAAFLELGDEITVAVGDSELDIPMFEVTDRGFAPSNASIEIKDMKKNRPTIMSKEYFEGVIEMYNNFF